MKYFDLWILFIYHSQYGYTIRTFIHPVEDREM